MAGRHSRSKGARTERNLVALMQQGGIAAEKISRSGYTGPDLLISLLGRDFKAESKARANGFKQLHAWLAGAEVLILKADRQSPLVVVPMRLAIRIARAANAWHEYGALGVGGSPINQPPVSPPPLAPNLPPRDD